MSSAFNPLISYLAPGSENTQAPCLEALRDKQEALERRIKRLRAQIREKRHETELEIVFTKQLLAVERIRNGLDCGVDARIRELEQSNRTLKSCLAEGELVESDEISSRGDSEPSAAQAARSDAEWYLADYAKRLAGAKIRTERRLRARNGHPGRRAIIGDWLKLYRESSCQCSLNELIGAVRGFERGS